jgi:hypothetical protein
VFFAFCGADCPCSPFQGNFSLENPDVIYKNRKHLIERFLRDFLRELFAKSSLKAGLGGSPMIS